MLQCLEWHPSPSTPNWPSSWGCLLNILIRTFNKCREVKFSKLNSVLSYLINHFYFRWVFNLSYITFCIKVQGYKDLPRSLSLALSLSLLLLMKLLEEDSELSIWTSYNHDNIDRVPGPTLLKYFYCCR